MLLISITVLGFGFEEDFSNEDGFGNAGFTDVLAIEEPYFIHDTLEKLIILIAFTLASIVIATKARHLRKVMLVASVGIIGFYIGGFLCPIAAVQNLIMKYDSAYLVLFLVPTFLAIALGRVFCGYICPFGAMQEFLHIRKWRIPISQRFLKTLQVGKYFVLVYLVIRVLATESIFGINLAPFSPLFRLQWNLIPVMATIAITLSSVFIYRPFCQFLCPLGAYLGCVSLINKRTIIPKDCLHCNQCSSQCGAQAITKGTIDKKECFVCGECLASCNIIPSKRSLQKVDLHGS